MATEFKLDDYTTDSGVSDSLLSKNSLLTYEEVDDTDFQDTVTVGAQFATEATGGKPGTNTLVYRVTGGGILNFGDGSDGIVTISANTTLASDKYYQKLIVNSGVTLNPGGYRIFVSEQLHCYGTIARNGNAGTNASGPTAGTGGAALADGYLKGSLAGGDGGGGGTTPGASGGVGAAGGNTTNSIGSNGTTGGNGGGTATGGGAGGTATTSNVKLIANWHLATLLDVSSTGATVKFDNSAASGGGTGGDASGGGDDGGGAGGAGSAGGIVAIYAKELIMYAGSIIESNGGNGGNGANAQGTAGGGGGGAGGNGGQLILVYNTIVENGTIQANAGTGGTAGTGTGDPATVGADGNTGTIRRFEVSL